MMRATSYKAYAKKLRELADKIEKNAEAQTSQEQRSLTLAVNGTAQAARLFFTRHSRAVEKKARKANFQ